MNIPFGSRSEVMRAMTGFVEESVEKYLKPIETNWQPSDFLPDSKDQDDFFDRIKDIQQAAQGLSYDLLTILVGDTITEEALPSYESWLSRLEGIHEESESNPWKVWVRGWTAEENRHGDLLNKYLFLSGRVNMQEFEKSTQFLIADGFNIETGQDPYRNFIYTSFQELATNISHRRVATIAKQQGDPFLSKINGVVAADELRHAKAYMSFIKKIIEYDASEVMVAFDDMMRKKIVMPAHFLRETGMKVGGLWGHFTDAAQRTGVYTAIDYANILQDLVTEWDLEHITDLNEAGEKARDYLVKLPVRLLKISERMANPTSEYEFKWIGIRS
ncbi:MAG: acyl-ACP desaturase [Saprospiraceae bacterium]|nr:acyl-ACP desaturase [Saprospiraceae bacterium]